MISVAGIRLVERQPTQSITAFNSKPGFNPELVSPDLILEYRIYARSVSFDVKIEVTTPDYFPEKSMIWLSDNRCRVTGSVHAE